MKTLLIISALLLVGFYPVSGIAEDSDENPVTRTLVWPDGHEALFHGIVKGELVWPPRGDRGFGFDPVFVADGETETFGEMDPAKKHAMSHRADAFEKLKAALL